jgi:hypothetical protein
MTALHIPGSRDAAFAANAFAPAFSVLSGVPVLEQQLGEFIQQAYVSHRAFEFICTARTWQVAAELRAQAVTSEVRSLVASPMIERRWVVEPEQRDLVVPSEDRVLLARLQVRAKDAAKVKRTWVVAAQVRERQIAPHNRVAIFGSECRNWVILPELREEVLDAEARRFVIHPQERERMTERQDCRHKENAYA